MISIMIIFGGYQDPLETIGKFFFTSYVRYATEVRFSFIRQTYELVTTNGS
jgi:hypothetical protein